MSRRYVSDLHTFPYETKMQDFLYTVLGEIDHVRNQQFPPFSSTMNNWSLPYLLYFAIVVQVYNVEMKQWRMQYKDVIAEEHNAN